MIVTWNVRGLNKIARHNEIGAHTNGIMYSRIDRAICNKSWFMKFPNSEIEILAPHISYHTPLKVVMDPDIPSRKKFQPRFKFLNSLVDDANFMEIVRDS